VALLIDQARWPAHGTHFAHLVSDASIEELHDFVATLQTPRPLRFHRDHYDVPAALWSFVVDQGVTVVSTREIVRRLRRAGLRA
jgi:hypothetical protein